jgi:membrane protease subunit HflK
VVRYAVTRIGSSILVDEILTFAKEEIQRMVKAEVQRLLDEYQCGLSVITVNINRMYPPEEVADAFRDVASAREDKSRTVNQAEGYRNSLIPPAKGEAEQMLRQAEGYKEEVINRAQGETQRFLQMLAEYRNTKGNMSSNVTRERLYLETIEKILPQVKKYILKSDSDGNVSLRFFE